MKTVLKNCRVLGTTHDKDMLHDIYVENGIIEKIGGSAMEAIARQPEASGDIRMNMIIAAALIEGVALLAVVVCLLVFFL